MNTESAGDAWFRDVESGDTDAVAAIRTGRADDQQLVHAVRSMDDLVRTA